MERFEVPTKREREELIGLLSEQIKFLEASAEGFDRGNEAEAKRLAVVIRTLVHDSRNTRSLLRQLDVKNRLRWIDTGQQIRDSNLAPTNGLAIVRVVFRDDETEAFYEPYFNQPPIPDRQNRPTTFDNWWTRPVSKDAFGNRFSRKDFVLIVANKEGGAHVDPETTSSYRDLTNLNSMGTFAGDGHVTIVGSPQGGKPAQGNVALVSIRQIAWEVHQTLLRQLPYLLFDEEDPRYPRSSLSEEVDCPCESGRSLRDCHWASSAGAWDLGVLLKERGEWLDAARSFEYASLGGNKDSLLELGMTLEGLGDYEGSARALEAAMEHGSDLAGNNLGHLFLEVGDFSGAKRAWEKGVELGHKRLHSNLGDLCTERGLLDEAERHFRAAIESGFYDACNGLGKVLRESGRMAEAAEAYSLGCENGLDSACHNAGLAYLEIGDRAKARSVFEKIRSSSDQELAMSAKVCIQRLDEDEAPAAR